MIRVLIAEDEPPIARALKTSIQNQDSEFEVVDTVMNGKKALEVIEHENIDVVFTDIRMPIMDGLELSENIEKNYQNIIVVITSGYSDFDYARRAIEYRVFDYLLKPVTSVKLKQILEKLQKEIQIRRQEEKHTKLLKGQKIEDDVSNCMIVVMCGGALGIYENDSMAPAAELWDSISTDKMMKMILSDDETYMTFPGKSISERIVVIEGIKSNERGEKVANEAFKILNNINDLTVTIGYIWDGTIDKVGVNIAKIRDMLLRRIILTKSQVIDCKIPYDGNGTQVYSNDSIREITEILKVGRQDKLQRELCKIFNLMEQMSATQEDITGFLDMIVNQGYLNIKSSSKKPPKLKKEINNAIANFSGYEMLSRDVAGLLLTMNETEISKKPKLIKEIENYLNEHYTESITNTVLSREFGFVPSYISRLFRQHNEVSPGEYLTKLRINKAKELMITEPDLLIKEIADQVGFKDAYYFSKIFKKETGSWPTEYTK